MSGEMQPEARETVLNWLERAKAPEDIVRQTNEQFSHSRNLRAREALYSYADPPLYPNRAWLYNTWGIIEIERKFTDELTNTMAEHGIAWSGQEKILDVGCGDGSYLLWLEFNQGHQGEMVGVDLNIAAAANKRRGIARSSPSKAPWMKAIKLGSAPTTQFRQGNAEDLDEEDNEFDIVITSFMHYHTGDPRKAFQEVKRVLKPGGINILLTRGPFNHLRMWQSVQNEITEDLKRKTMYRDIVPPHSFYYRLDLDKAEAALREYDYDILSQFRQSYSDQPDEGFTINIPLRQWEIYRQALHSLRSSFEAPTDSLAQQLIKQDDKRWRRDVNRAIKRQVMPRFYELAGKNKGVFPEYIDQGYFIARNNK